MEQPTLLAQWLANERIAAYIPETPWAQISVGLLGLGLLMLLAGWLTSSVVTTIARRTLVAMGHQDWSVSLSRRRVFRSISYAAPLLVVAGNIGLLPIEEKYLSFIARMFLSVGLVFVFM